MNQIKSFTNYAIYTKVLLLKVQAGLTESKLK